MQCPGRNRPSAGAYGHRLDQLARYGSPETPSLPNWPACTPGDEATMIFDRTCEIRRNFDHELVKKLVETEYNPMTPVVEDEEEDAFLIH